MLNELIALEKLDYLWKPEQIGVKHISISKYILHLFSMLKDGSIGPKTLFPKVE